MDLRWRYNNVQMRERDEWKAVFTIYLGVYESIVMFFGLTNSLAMFQAMMNDILQNLIDTRDVVVFMDNMLVETENERKHNKIVEKILRRMKLNNLYLKPKKCV